MDPPPLLGGSICFRVGPNLVITPRCECARAGLSIYNYIDKTASNTLNTYLLYCCKSLPRTVNQILHLPSSLRSKNSLHGLRWGGFWIATPLPAIQIPPRQISQHAQLPVPRIYAQSRGLDAKKNQEAFSEGSREPAISGRTRMQMVCIPTTILLLSKEG